MARKLLTIMFILCWSAAFSQNKDTSEYYEVGKDVYEKIAAPANGMISYYEWINNNNYLKNSSDSLLKNGKVWIQFMVSKTGKLNEFEVLKGIGEPYDSTAINLIKGNPVKWLPAENRGIKYNSKMILPISFIAIEHANQHHKNRYH